MKPAISIRELGKRYRGAQTLAVDDISFDVDSGSFFALLGPNGAGKTTTISILTTTLAPSAGTARVAGFDVVSQASQVRQRTGIIFQKPSLDLNLTAEENVRFHAFLYGLFPYRPTFGSMSAAYKRKVAELAAVLDIEKDLFKPIKTFSGGMRRKLEIVRSLIHEPQVLFLDEPTAGLDAESRRSLWDYLTQVQATNETTIFLTTHYLEEAEKADEICILDHGKVVSFGPPDRIKTDLVEEYLLVDADHRERLLQELKHLGISFRGSGPFRLDLNGRDVHQVLKALETPLSLVKTHAPSLEDAYLEVIRRSSWK